MSGRAGAQLGGRGSAACPRRRARSRRGRRASDAHPNSSHANSVTRIGAQLASKRGGGDGGEQQRPVPQEQVAGKEHARPQETWRSRSEARGPLSRRRSSQAHRRKQRQRKSAAPEGRRRRSGLGQPHEDPKLPIASAPANSASNAVTSEALRRSCMTGALAGCRHDSRSHFGVSGIIAAHCPPTRAHRMPA